MKHTNLIVLRKTQYRESSIIVTGLTPEHGRLDVIVKGAKKLSSKNFPAVDLFREINIEVNHKKSGLYSIYSADLVSNHDNIASFHNNYLQACDICSFTLRNSQPDIPSPVLYNALKNIFETLADSETIIPYTALIKLVYLDEHGLLPEVPENDQTKKELLSQLLKVGKEKAQIPEISEKYWKVLETWIDSLCHFHELRY